MRLKVTSTKSPPAGLAVARLLRITPREALTLLREARVLPLELDGTAAEAARAALHEVGVEAAPVEVPLTTSRCPAHPALTGDGPCEDCRAQVCPLCLPRCRPCSARRASAARRKRARVAVLLTALLSLAGWAGWRQRTLERRTAWQRPLRVSVILVSAAPVEERVTTAWRDGLGSLNDWFAAEAARRGVALPHPLRFELAPAAVLADAPSPPAQGTGEWLLDSRAAIALRSSLKALADQGKASGQFDVQLVIALRTSAGHRVEGLGEAGGTLGLVDGTAGDTELTLELIAVAHELLHCLGARDAYDAQGHALARGVVEPGLGFPQRFAEVMVGEVPLAEGEGRLPRSLEEVRIGAETAREVGWVR